MESHSEGMHFHKPFKPAIFKSFLHLYHDCYILNFDKHLSNDSHYENGWHLRPRLGITWNTWRIFKALQRNALKTLRIIAIASLVRT